MAGAIALGALSGIVGFLPLIAALHITKHNVRSGLAGSMMFLFLGIFVSFAILVMTAIFWIAFDKSLGFPFVIAEVVALSVSAIAFGLARTLNR